MPFHHVLCGLGLSSNRIIPGLADSAPGTATDVEVLFGVSPADRERTGPSERVWYTSPHTLDSGRPLVEILRTRGYARYRIRFYDDVELFIDRLGRRVWATWPAPLPALAAMHHLVFSTVGLLLALRGIVCMHACAIAHQGSALLCCGPSGVGKSLLSLSLAREGHPVLSDDVVALADLAGTFVTYPGYPFLSLRPGSLASLAPETRRGLRYGDSWDYLEQPYVSLSLADNGLPFQSEPVPLGGVYFLRPDPGHRQHPSLARETPTGSLFELLRSASATRFPQSGFLEREFESLSRLAHRLPASSLLWNPDRTGVEALGDLVLSDFATALASPPAVASSGGS